MQIFYDLLNKIIMMRVVPVLFEHPEYLHTINLLTLLLLALAAARYITTSINIILCCCRASESKGTWVFDSPNTEFRFGSKPLIFFKLNHHALSMLQLNWKKVFHNQKVINKNFLKLLEEHNYFKQLCKSRFICMFSRDKIPTHQGSDVH